MEDRIWHPFTKFSSLHNEPLLRIVGGQGIHLFDDSGKEYIDAISSWWCCNLGHGNQRLINAIREQSGKLQHSILGNLSNPWAEKLASRLCETMPSPERHVVFASDGACSVEAALKIAVQYHNNRGDKRRNRFLALKEGYHGDTLGAVSVGYVPEFHSPFEKLITRQITVPLPDYINGEGLAPTERVFEKNGQELAAVIVEPLCQGAAGMRMYDSRYLSDLISLCRINGVLMIVDEIAMGFGRTGKYWAFQHAGIDPDIICVGKGLTAGYLPLSACICRDQIFETFTDTGATDHTFYHGHTFAGNPIAAACALEAMKIYDEMRVTDRVIALEGILKQEFGRALALEGVRDVRVMGLIGAVELEKDGKAQPKDIRRELINKGVLLRPLGNVFYIMPPMIIDEKQLAGLCSSIVEVIQNHLR